MELESLNKVFTEKDVEEVSNKILKSTIEKIKDELSERFYNDTECFLYEHYSNVSDRIHKELIDEITEEFVKDPKAYKFFGLRKKLFNENEELLIDVLTEEAVENAIKNVILKYADEDYVFQWRWMDAILKVILENWDKLKDDKRMNSAMLREIEQLNNKINQLQKTIKDMKEIVD